MWLQIDATEKSIEQLEKCIEHSATFFSDSYADISSNIENIGNYIPKIKEKNPGLIEELQDAMW